MMKNIYLLVATLFFSMQSIANEKVSLKVIAPSSVEVGDQFKLVFNINMNVKDKTVEGFNSVEFSGFEVLVGPIHSITRTEETNSFGLMKESYVGTYTFILMATKIGMFTIPPVKLKIDNEEFISEPTTVQIESKKKLDVLSDKDFFVRVKSSKENIILGEKIVIEYSLYWNKVEIVNLKSIEPRFVGFKVVKMKPDLKTEIINEADINYNSCKICEYELYPQHAGELEIEPMKFLFTLRKEKDKTSLDNFFAKKTMGEPFEWEIESDKVKISVKDNVLKTVKPSKVQWKSDEYQSF